MCHMCLAQYACMMHGNLESDELLISGLYMLYMLCSVSVEGVVLRAPFSSDCCV